MPEVRPIDANAMKAEVESLDAESNNRTYESAMKDMLRFFLVMIDEQPTIEAEPVRRGRWISYGSDTAYTKYYRCSLCDYEIAGYAESNDLIKYNYCPNCGADMREAIEDADDN